MPSPSAPSRLKNGQYAGKSTLSSADMQDEYFDHAAPEGSHSPYWPFLSRDGADGDGIWSK
jgi:phospholipase C